MISLTFELSSARASLALMDGERKLGACGWPQANGPGRETFTQLSSLLEATRVEPAQIESFIIGRGPGTFSALRIAHSAARAFALPGAGTVYAVSSGAAIAFGLRESEGITGPIAVVGDARRNSVWIGCFEAGSEGTSNRDQWRVIQSSSFPGSVPDDTIFVSPQFGQLEYVLPRESFTTHTWHPHHCFPEAIHVARVSAERKSRGIPTEPLEPLYLHPPVSTTRPGKT